MPSKLVVLAAAVRIVVVAVLLFTQFLSTIAAAQDSDSYTADPYTVCPAIAEPAARLACYDSYVQSAQAEIEGQRQLRGQPYIRQLRSDGPNSLGFVGPVGNAELSGNQHVEFNISVRYPFWEQQDEIAQNETPWKGFLFGVDRSFLVYNGTYDFHLLPDEYGDGNRYDSAPVIYKDQNPGLVLEWDIDADRLRRLRLGVFHHSNGQTLGEENVAKFNDAVLEGGLGYALNQVSRSSNYVQLRYQRVANAEENITTNWHQFQMELRPVYFSVDDKIFWEPNRIHQPDIQDYDGLRLMNEKFYSLNPISSFLESTALITRVELKTGIRDARALSNISSEWTVGLMWRKLMLTASYFDGYGKEISTYHLRTRHWGLGLEIR